MNINELPRSSTASGFAGRHSLSLSTVYRLIRSGALSAYKVNNATRISETDELAWLASIRTDSGEES